MSRSWCKTSKIKLKNLFVKMENINGNVTNYKYKKTAKSNNNPHICLLKRKRFSGKNR